MKTNTYHTKLIDALWRIVEPLGWERQKLTDILITDGPTAILAAHAAAAVLGESLESYWVKNPTPFKITDSLVLESPLDKLTEFLTPNHLFFVCHDTKTPRIQPESYMLKVEGDAIERPLILSYDDLLRLPSRTLPLYLECAGNHRALYEKVLGQQVPYTQWMLGGVGMAEWTGVPLHVVLEMAGIKADAAYVNLKGLDEEALEGGISRPMPIEKALAPDTLLAYLMNGELLPPDHGFPLRAIVPGWVGANSIKWVGTITVSTEEIWVNRNTETYVLEGAQWPPTEYAPAKGAPVTTQNIKSSLALPYPATLSAGAQTIRGFARSPHAKIAQVEWSADNGQTWQPATLLDPNLKYAWVRFEFRWNASPGKHTLITRATDELGNTQPDLMPFNKQGYLFNMSHPHPVTVTSNQ